jgi:hypothetical protein
MSNVATRKDLRELVRIMTLRFAVGTLLLATIAAALTIVK